MISRRRFIGQTSLIAGSAVVANAMLPGVGAASDDPQTADPKLLDRAKALLEKAPLIDTHNDLPSVFLETKAGDLTSFDMSKVQPTLCADIPSLREGRVGAQYWSVFVESSTQRTHTSLHEAMRELDVALRFIQTNADLEQARTADDIERIHKSGRIACLLGVEGGHMIENSPAALRNFCALGARYMTLTHIKNNDWADSATDTPAHHGLTPFGEEVVREMNRLGMLVDLSHVSDETMVAAMRISKAPVIFSHSSARALCHHARDVPDDILKMVTTNGGLVMVTFVPEYLTEPDRLDEIAVTAERKRLAGLYPGDDAKVKPAVADWRKTHPDPRKATLLDVADHIDHVRAVAGIDHLGIGSDYEGFHNPPAGLEDVSCYPALLAELLKRGYSEDDIKKVAGQNLLRVLRAAEQVATQLNSR